MSSEGAVFYSRLLTEFTLSFHIIFATIGVGVPMMIMIAQWLGIKKNDEHYILLARRIARGYVITVAVGVVTGTAFGLQLSLLWPNFMELAGNVIAWPLFMEVFAFFFEAIFLSIYLYTWDRFEDQKKHFLLLIPVTVGSFISALFITSVNAFMNSPQGFDLVDGQLKNVQPILAMFTPAMPTKVGHVIATAYMTLAFVLAAIAAFKMLKGSKHVYHKKSLFLFMKVGLIFAVASALIGDFSAKYLNQYQPEKLAAAEWHFETHKGADLVLFGVLDEKNETIKYEIRIPKMLSFLANSDFNSEVKGLNDFPKDETPTLFVHYLFDFMVVVGVLMIVVSAGYVLGRIRKWRFIESKAFLWLVVISGPLTFLALEAGWWFAELGRQPWILVKYMKIAEAATTSDHVGLMATLFGILYVILAIGTVVVLRRIFKSNPIERELVERHVEDGESR